MDTDEAGDVCLEPEGTAVDTQKKLRVFEKCNTLFIRWGYTLECDRAFRRTLQFWLYKVLKLNFWIVADKQPLSLPIHRKIQTAENRCGSRKLLMASNFRRTILFITYQEFGFEITPNKATFSWCSLMFTFIHGQSLITYKCH